MTRDIGLTGSRHGLPDPQRVSLGNVLARLLADSIHARQPGQTLPKLHQGCCTGADRSALAIWHNMGGLGEHHPGDEDQRRWALSNKTTGEAVHAVLPYLHRNHVIVDSTCRLVAAPSTMEEQLRSGTWSTIRYARKLGRPVTIVLPDGSVSQEP